MEYAIREFCITDNRDAERLAEMWNASDKGWPGGWTRGIPDTAQRVLDRKRQMDGLAMYVVEREGKIVGYGDLTAQAGQKRLAYVSLLNVQPEHQGKSLGRHLILALLETGQCRVWVHRVGLMGLIWRSRRPRSLSMTCI